MTAPRKPKKPASKAVILSEAYKRLEDAQRELAEAEDLVRNGTGRRTAYRPEFATRATGLCLLGLTNEELAERFEVDLKTLEGWMREVPAFAGAIYDGREGADQKVLAALFKSAIGYEHEEDDIRTVSLGNNQGSQIEITRTVKRYPPNINATALILANRQRRRWPVASVNSAQGGGTGEQTPEDLARAAQAAIRAALDDSAAPNRPTQDKES